MVESKMIKINKNHYLNLDKKCYFTKNKELKFKKPNF